MSCATIVPGRPVISLLFCRGNVRGGFRRFGREQTKDFSLGCARLNGETFGFTRKRQGSGKMESSIVSGSASAETSTETVTAEEAEWKQFQERVFAHQKAAAKLSHVEEARVVVDEISNGTLSTISQKFAGAPVGSMVTYAADEDGRPILAISTLSPHTKDLEMNPKCSLLVPRDPHDKSDTVVTVIGEALPVLEEELEVVRGIYLRKHPGAFWVDFGDFRFLRIEPKKIRFVTGIATGLAAVAEFTAEEFKSAPLDAIATFSTPIATHMNKDHQQQTNQIVEYSVGIKVEFSRITHLDRLGFNVVSGREGKNFKLRIPFPRLAVDRMDVKNLIVEMLKASQPPDTTQA